MSCCMSVNVRLIINHMILYKKSTSITYLKYLGTRVAYNFIFRTKAASINMIDWTINYRYFRHHKWQKSGSVNNLAVTLKSQINHLKLKTYHQRQSIPLKIFWNCENSPPRSQSHSCGFIHVNTSGISRVNTSETAEKRGGVGKNWSVVVFLGGAMLLQLFADSAC